LFAWEKSKLLKEKASLKKRVNKVFTKKEESQNAIVNHQPLHPETPNIKICVFGY